LIVDIQWVEREVFNLIAGEQTNTKLQISEAQYQHTLKNASKIQERLGHGIQVMPTAARMTREVYKRAFLGKELLQKGDAPIKCRYSWACITGELDRNKGHRFGLIETMTVWPTESMNRTATMKQNQQKHNAVMAQIHRERRDNKRASAWLAKHSPKTKPKPKPKPQPLERWQIRVREQKQERRALAKPLLKGVE
jgi:hypothetical protein